MEAVMGKMLKALQIVSLLAAAAPVMLAPTTAAAAETNEEYIEEARPFLHLSCESAWEGVNRDEGAYLDILAKLAPVHFINYDFDVKKLEALPAKELESLRVEYYNEIGKACRENPSRLLAGVVEGALVNSFAKLAP
jgi:hypothetical protein